MVLVMDSAFWCLSQITIELLSKIRLTDLWLDILGWEKTPSLSSPITMPPGRIMLVHWGQKNSEIKIESRIDKLLYDPSSLVLDGRIASLRAQPATPTGSPKHLRHERIIIRWSGDQEIRRSGGSLTLTDMLGHRTEFVLWLSGGTVAAGQSPTSNST